MRLDRVILSSDANPLYADFWPLVATAWQRFAGLRPTLALIGERETRIDARLGDVVRFEPIAGVSTALHAQVIRLLLPTLFPRDVCLLADIDMLPLSGRYFTRAVASLPSDRFVVYRDGCYSDSKRRFPICYNAARGETFQDVFGTDSADGIARRVAQWSGLDLGWHTDELMLYELVQRWSQAASRCVRLGHDARRRIDRSDWRYAAWLVPFGRYRDAHLPRPYAAHRDDIGRLARWAGLGG